MKIRPHITDPQMRLSQEQIAQIQRADMELLNAYADQFHRLARDASERTEARVVVMCNVETEETLPAPLDWDGVENALGLEPPIYRSAKRALDKADLNEQVVVLAYRASSDMLSIYTVSP